MIYRIRLQIADWVRGHMPGPEGSFAAAIMTGDRSAIPVSVTENLRAAKGKTLQRRQVRGWNCCANLGGGAVQPRHLLHGLGDVRRVEALLEDH